MRSRKERSLILDPGEFYILASKEAVQVPPDYAAEMVPFDPLMGEFRVHYAGFFDPGFGYAGAGGHGDADPDRPDREQGNEQELRQQLGRVPDDAADGRAG